MTIYSGVEYLSVISSLKAHMRERLQIEFEIFWRTWSVKGEGFLSKSTKNYKTIEKKIKKKKHSW